MKRQQLGITLIELVIAVAIIGVLAAFAIPAYQEQTTKSRRADGQAFMLDLQARLERHHFDNNGYPLDLTGLGYASNPTDSPEGHYSVSLAGSSCGQDPDGNNVDNTCNAYLLTANPLGGQLASGDGALTLASNGNKLPADKW